MRAKTRGTAHHKFICFKQSQTTAIAVRARPVPPVFAQCQICVLQTLVIHPFPFIFCSTNHLRKKYLLFSYSLDSFTFKEAKANVEDKLINRVLLLGYLDDLFLEHFELVIIFNCQKCGVQWQAPTETLGVQPGELLTLAREVNTRTIVEDTARHTFGQM